jgi:beta-glucanase (GH16 family)
MFLKKERRNRMKKLFVSLSILITGVMSVYALPPASAGYGLVWSDEFDGTSLDTINNWNFDTIPRSGAQWYIDTRSCVTVENGNLTIWSKYNPNAAIPDKYTSSWIDSHDKKIFTYGYFEARVKAPLGQVSGPGLWAAVWLLGNSIHHGTAWPLCGEMELYDQRPSNEIVNPPSAQPVPAIIGDNEFLATCHYANGSGYFAQPVYHTLQHNYSAALSDRFHTYGLLWDSLHVEYYFDDTLFWDVDFPANFGVPNINLPENFTTFHSPFFWIINVAVGGSYQGYNINNAIFPTKMELDYVRVYQKGIVKTVNKNVKQQTSRSFALINPSTAQLKVFDLSGKLVADYTNKVKRMKAGENVMKILPSAFSNGIYVLTLIDNGLSASRILVTAQ